MAFIDSRPELSTLSQMLRWAGYERRLSGPFYGTLLLPTNDVSAWQPSSCVVACFNMPTLIQSLILVECFSLADP
jgi:hypothetical protein